MKKLSLRDTYTPTDASQVCSNCGLSLNKEEILSVKDLKTLDNRSEVNLLVSEVPEQMFSVVKTSLY